MAATADVLVTVGTDHHPFDRLVGWIDTWATLHPATKSLVQRGTSTAPEGCRSVEYLPFEGLRRAIDGASVVISHGGPATIMDVRAAGRLPVVVPRRPDLGEHVDAHQVRFCRWMAGRGQVLLAEDEATLHRLLDDALASPASVRIDPHDPGVDAAVRRFGDLIDGLLAR